jgi:hypothetical protein
MSYGLHKLTAAASTIGAREDYAALLRLCQLRGINHSSMHIDPMSMGFRRLDKHNAALLEVLQMTLDDLAKAKEGR